MQTQRQRLSTNSTFTPPHAERRFGLQFGAWGAQGGGIEEAHSGRCLNESEAPINE